MPPRLIAPAAVAPAGRDGEAAIAASAAGALSEQRVRGIARRDAVLEVAITVTDPLDPPKPPAPPRFSAPAAVPLNPAGDAESAIAAAVADALREQTVSTKPGREDGAAVGLDG